MISITWRAVRVNYPCHRAWLCKTSVGQGGFKVIVSNEFLVCLFVFNLKRCFSLLDTNPSPIAFSFIFTLIFQLKSHKRQTDVMMKSRQRNRKDKR